jgi:hypothetical protein
LNLAIKIESRNFNPELIRIELDTVFRARRRPKGALSGEAVAETQKPEYFRLEQFTNKMSGLLCEDLKTNPCRQIGADWLCRPLSDYLKRYLPWRNASQKHGGIA